MSELSELLTENPAAAGSPTHNTMMHGKTDKLATSFSFSEKVKNTLGNFFSFTMRAVKGAEVDTQKEEEENGGIDGFQSKVSLNNSTRENRVSTIMENGYSDRFGAV